MVGTRPEVIKQVPLFLAIKDVFPEHKVELVSTGQHQELLNPTL